MATYLDVDPATLHLPPSRYSGADPWKLQQQIIRFGASTAGVPPPWAGVDVNGEVMLYNGVTRATRVAKLAPGTLFRVEVVQRIKKSIASVPTIGDTLP